MVGRSKGQIKAFRSRIRIGIELYFRLASPLGALTFGSGLATMGMLTLRTHGMPIVPGVCSTSHSQHGQPWSARTSRRIDGWTEGRPNQHIG